MAHVYDLVSLTRGATRDAAAMAEDRGLRAARLQAVKRDILDRLADTDLSIGTVAARHGITPRYIGMLFHGEGTSFTAFVLDQRLARARAALSDFRSARRRISDFASASGLCDLSYFNRNFRRRYGASPRQVRRLGSADGMPAAAALP